MDLASPPAHETYSPGRAGSSDRRDEDCDTDSLTWVARHAWRMADRCVGRSGWRSLIVRNRTHLTELGDIVEDLEEHLRLTTNDGRIRPVATVYHPSIRFRAEQLIRYAGDPQYAGYAATCHRLGWRSNGDQFDILPVSFELPDGSAAPGVTRPQRDPRGADRPPDGALVQRPRAALARRPGDLQHAAAQRGPVLAVRLRRLVRHRRDRRP